MGPAVVPVHQAGLGRQLHFVHQCPHRQVRQCIRREIPQQGVGGMLDRLQAVGAAAGTGTGQTPADQTGPGIWPGELAAVCADDIQVVEPPHGPGVFQPHGDLFQLRRRETADQERLPACCAVPQRLVENCRPQPVPQRSDGLLKSEIDQSRPLHRPRDVHGDAQQGHAVLPQQFQLFGGSGLAVVQDIPQRNGLRPVMIHRSGG